MAAHGCLSEMTWRRSAVREMFQALCAVQEGLEVCRDVGWARIGVHDDPDLSLRIDEPERRRVGDLVATRKGVDDPARQRQVVTAQALCRRRDALRGPGRR